MYHQIKTVCMRTCSVCIQYFMIDAVIVYCAWLLVLASYSVTIY